MMKLLSLTLCLLVITGCSTHVSVETADQQVKSFYQKYLQMLASDKVSMPPGDEEKFVASDTLRRLNAIVKMPEQERVESDYFTYTQDYDPKWISRLQVLQARPFMGGATVDVLLGIEEGKSLHLRTWLRRENGGWKIYRVKDLSDNFEHRIFDL